MTDMTSATDNIHLRSYIGRIPFASHLGIEIENSGAANPSALHGEARALNTFDVTHGGVVMTMLDIARPPRQRATRPEIGVVTIEMKTTFMAPSVGPLIARGKLLHRTATMAFTEAKIYDAQERSARMRPAPSST